MTETCPLYALALMNEQDAGDHPPLGMTTRIELPSSKVVELGKCGLQELVFASSNQILIELKMLGRILQSIKNSVLSRQTATDLICKRLPPT
jgi:hypothetical protein